MADPETVDVEAVRTKVRHAIEALRQDVRAIDGAITDMSADRCAAEARRELLEKFLEWPDALIQQLVAGLANELPDIFTPGPVTL